MLVTIRADLPAARWKALPRGAWLRAESLRRKCRAGAVLSARLNSPAHGLVIVGLLREKATPFEALQLAGRMLKEARSAQPRRSRSRHWASNRVPRDARSRRCLPRRCRRRSSSRASSPRSSDAVMLSEITLFDPDRHDFAATAATSEGNNLARWLTALPRNQLTPASYRERVAALARREGWRVRFFDRRQLERRGAGAFLAVTQGTEDATRRHHACAVPRRRWLFAAQARARRQGHLLRHRRHQSQDAQEHAGHAHRHAGQCRRTRHAARARAPQRAVPHRLLARDHGKPDRPEGVQAAGRGDRQQRHHASRSFTPMPKDAWCSPIRWHSLHANSQR